MRREHVAYALAVIMDMCLMATIFFAVTRRAADAGADAMKLGWLAGAFYATYGIMSPICGKIADRYGRRRFVAIGLIGCGLLIYLCGWETRYNWLLVWTGGTGVTAAMFWPALMSWLSEGRRGKTLAVILGSYCVCWNGGLAIGSFGGGELYEKDPWLAFAVYGSILIVAPVLLLLRTRPPRNQELELEGARAGHEAEFFVRAAWLANLVVLLGLGGVTAMFPQLATHLGIRPSVHGWIVASSRLAAVAAFIMMRWSHHWQHRLWLFYGSFVVGCAGSMAVALGSNEGLLFAGFIGLGFVSGTTYLASVYYAMEAFEGKAVGAGWTELILGMGMFLGPLMAGKVGVSYGLRAPYYFVAVLFVAGGVVLAAMALRRRPARDKV